ncbi:hypothetical protein [Hymenobacter psychrophilus]|uniref:Outer membrane protein beta-barrel domain-containing protein n=1 Tax=Hymenobacter psychrophilus TaxID=651662 RepID=A0A1H3GVF8_9BACT|nr:hypothetical protein [Hymenobacter psychrophilus]SDY06628.1 hypothetical protein SAMN04488069_105169 [Hymenobacter psychrophilus]
MSRFLYLLPAALLLAFAAQAQDTTPVAPKPGLRPSYSLQAGTTFAGRYGSASYLSPTVSLPLSKRFAVFGGLTYLRTVPGAAYAPLGETGRALPLAGTNRLLIQGGGQYALSERLSLTGSAWKDLTPAGQLSVNPYAGFGGNLGQGVNLRADYHITENFSVSGGVRVSSGATAAPGSYYGSPWGY